MKNKSNEEIQKIETIQEWMNIFMNMLDEKLKSSILKLKKVNFETPENEKEEFIILSAELKGVTKDLYLKILKKNDKFIAQISNSKTLLKLTMLEWNHDDILPIEKQIKDLTNQLITDFVVEFRDVIADTLLKDTDIHIKSEQPLENIEVYSNKSNLFDGYGLIKYLDDRKLLELIYVRLKKLEETQTNIKKDVEQIKKIKK